MDRGEMVFITSDDIVNLIDENSELLYNEAGLNFLEPDKAALKNDLYMLDEFSEFCNDYLTGWFTGGLIQTYFSLLFLNFLEVLFIIVLVQWLLVYRLNGRRMCSALKKYSITLMVPSGLIFIASMSLLFLDKKSVGGVLTSYIRNSFIISSAIILAVGIILLVISIAAGKKKKPATASESIAAADTTVSETTQPTVTAEALDKSLAENALPEEKSDTVDVKKTETATAEPKKVFCTKCGAENKENSKFCSKCGEKIVQD